MWSSRVTACRHLSRYLPTFSSSGVQSSSRVLVAGTQIHTISAVNANAHKSADEAQVRQGQEPTLEAAQVDESLKSSEPDSSKGKLRTAVKEDGQDVLYKTLELEVLAYEPAVLDSYQWFVMTTASHLGIPIGKCWSPLKSDKHRFNLLKSAFVHKKHQVHYEFRTYHRFLTFHHLTGSTADTFLEYVERNLPEGCGLKVTRTQVYPLPKFLDKAK